MEDRKIALWKLLEALDFGINEVLQKEAGVISNATSKQLSQNQELHPRRQRRIWTAPLSEDNLPPGGRSRKFFSSGNSSRSPVKKWLSHLLER